MQRLFSKTVFVFGSLVLASAAWSPASAQGPTVRAAQAGVVKVGERAPEFSLPASDGKAYRLADLRGAKRLVLVIFRGVW
jgi:cytochrome oxidase Cu insertion factor (SCO1/SenC/PrrC family)